jgi:hypothetical protein
LATETKIKTETEIVRSERIISEAQAELAEEVADITKEIKA